MKSVLRKFWAVEEVSYDEMGIDEKILKEFNDTIYFNGERYVTGLPLKSKDDFMPDNFRLAYRRFMMMVSTKLDTDPKLKKEYKDIFESYER